MKSLSKKLFLVNQTVVDCLGEFEEQTIVRKFTETGIRAMQADFGFVWFGDAHSSDFELMYKSPSIPYEPLPPRKDGSSRKVLLDAKPVLIENLSDSDFVRDDAKPHMQSLVVIPMHYKNRAHGSIFLCFKKTRHFTDEDYELAHFIGNSSAQAITISRLYAELQEADRKKDNFIAILAHELRNPLAPLLSALQILQLHAAQQHPTIDSMVEGSIVREFSEIAERQVQNMKRILDDLLDVSRITRGKLQLEKEPVDLVALVHDTVRATYPKIEVKGHILRVAVPEDSLMVYGDPVRLEQVLINLLNNAADYMPNGGVIDVEAGRAGNKVSLSVRDQGIGMSPEVLSKIFDSFFRADASKERAKDGLGLGLMLSKNIIEMHGGQIVAESEGVGHGSTFTIYLPVWHSRDERAPEEDKKITIVPKKKKILVVDDNRAAADTLVELLRYHGYEVDVAYNAEEALKRVPAGQPQVALLDIGLPAMDGYELAQVLKRYDPRLRLIAISGYGQKEDIHKSRKVGFHHHLVKPVNIETLLKLI